MGSETDNARCSSPRFPARCAETVIAGVGYGYLTVLIVAVGLAFGNDYLHRQKHTNWHETGFGEAIENWDGVWYARVLRDGYQHDATQQQSTTNFFPGYPCLAGIVVRVTGTSPENALMLITAVSLCGVWILLPVYVRTRFPHAEPELASWTVVAFGLWPTTLFFRLACSESLFAICLMLILLGIERRWPIGVVAACCGLATGISATGIALVPVVWCYLWWWHGAASGDSGCQKSERHIGGRSLWNALWVVPTSLAGLLAHMLFLHFYVGDALAFVRQQSLSSLRSSLTGWDHLISCLTMEPIWSLYDPSSEAFWARREPEGLWPVLSFEFMNPVFYVSTVALVIWGYRKSWINRAELTMSASLLLIPCWTKNYEVMMQSHVRYSAVVIPIYWVLGNMLYRCRPFWNAIACSVSGTMLGIYTALFAAWHRVF